MKNDDALTHLAWCGYECWYNMISGNQYPAQTMKLDRLNTPLIGDIIIEKSTIFRRTPTIGKFRSRQAEANFPHHRRQQTYSELNWLIKDLRTNRRDSWNNCSFIVLLTRKVADEFRRDGVDTRDPFSWPWRKKDRRYEDLIMARCVPWMAERALQLQAEGAEE